MNGKKIIKTVLITFMMGLSVNAFSQSMNEAGDAFNKGIQQASAGNVDAAIDAYEKTVSIADQLGGEGMDLKFKAQQQLAKLYLNSGLNNYKAKKFSTAEKDLKKSAEYAEKVGDEKTLKTANAYVARVNYSFGLSLLKKNEVDQAMTNLNEALKYDPDYYKAYYGLALVYKAKDMPAEMENAVSKMIELGGDDTKYINRTKSVAEKFFLKEGSKALQAKNYETAVDYLNQSLKYGEPDANTYYYLAIANNSSGKPDAAIEAVEKGLQLEEGDKSNLYFEKAKAHEAKGNVTAACDAYKKVNSGPNQELAKYKIETELKCG